MHSPLAEAFEVYTPKDSQITISRHICTDRQAAGAAAVSPDLLFDEAAVVSWRLPLEHTDIEIHEIESLRRTTATSFPVACEC
jgi:hypothetical protein